jgi:hypothetical protein
MQYLRLLHPCHWSRRKSKFSGAAFRNFPPPGISVIRSSCALASGHGAVCGHIAHYYENPPAPVIFWVFEEEGLPEPNTIDHEVTANGDECHYNINGLSDAASQEYFENDFHNHRWTNFRSCPGGQALTLETLEAWIIQHTGRIQGQPIPGHPIAKW